MAAGHHSRPADLLLGPRRERAEPRWTRRISSGSPRFLAGLRMLVGALAVVAVTGVAPGLFSSGPAHRPDQRNPDAASRSAAPRAADQHPSRTSGPASYRPTGNVFLQTPVRMLRLPPLDVPWPDPAFAATPGGLLPVTGRPVPSATP